MSPIRRRRRTRSSGQSRGGRKDANPIAPTTAPPIYADRAFDRLPILADAFEDAGCDNPDILTHCRQPGEHVRGCWVINLRLGKA
jgi:hypothetical protein